MKVQIVKSDDRDTERFQVKVNAEIERIESLGKITDVKFEHGKEGADGYHFAYILYTEKEKVITQ